MAQDDMHVVMYKILAYLYDCMKRGQTPKDSMLAHDGDMLNIPYTYWVSIWKQLAAHRYVTGVVSCDTLSGEEIVLQDPKVTMEGVEFMQENEKMRKALAWLKEIKSALPFI